MSTSSSRVTERSVAGFEDAHVGRPILERADEVFGVAAGCRCPRDRRARRDRSCRRRPSATRTARSARPTASAIGLPSPSVICAGRRRPIGEHVHADIGAGRRVDVAAVGLGARRQPQAGRIGVVDVDARDARRMRDGDVVGRRRHRAGDDAVLERGVDRRQRQAERTRRRRLAISDARQRSPSAICTCAMIGARLPTSRAWIASARAGLDPRVAGRDFERDARRETASATRRRAPAAPGRARPTARRRARAPTRPPGSRRGADDSPAAMVSTSTSARPPRGVGEHQIGEHRRRAAPDCATSTAVTRRSSSDGARSSMKRATWMSPAIGAAAQAPRPSAAQPAAARPPTTTAISASRRRPSRPARARRSADADDARHATARRGRMRLQRASARATARGRDRSARGSFGRSCCITFRTPLEVPELRLNLNSVPERSTPSSPRASPSAASSTAISRQRVLPEVLAIFLLPRLDARFDWRRRPSAASPPTENRRPTAAPDPLRADRR